MFLSIAIASVCLFVVVDAVAVVAVVAVAVSAAVAHFFSVVVQPFGSKPF